MPLNVINEKLPPKFDAGDTLDLFWSKMSNKVKLFDLLEDAGELSSTKLILSFPELFE
jgi:hypothetical protein